MQEVGNLADGRMDRARWGIAVAAIVMHTALGAARAWSVFVKPLKELKHWSTTEVSLAFTIAGPAVAGS